MKLLLASTSAIHGSGYLEYCDAPVKAHFEGVKNLVFVPYARPGGLSHDAYTALARKKFEEFGITVTGLHTFDDPKAGVRQAEGVFIGGGNTFVLTNELYRQGLPDVIREVVADGTPYMGSSAGSNVACKSISTTNDMPIIYPPTFEGLGLVPFNINPHYLDPDPDSTHRGETRETRIKEFHVFNGQPVVGLREGSILLINDDSVKLWGELNARVFRQGAPPREMGPEADFDWLLEA